MKAVLCLLVPLPLALSLTHNIDVEELNKRFLINLKKYLPSAESLGQMALNLLGSDTSEAACEAACNKALNSIFPGLSAIGGSLIHPACQWVQQKVQQQG